MLYCLAKVIVLHRKSSACTELSSMAISPYALSMRLAARQMWIVETFADRNTLGSTDI